MTVFTLPAGAAVCADGDLTSLQSTTAFGKPVRYSQRPSQHSYHLDTDFPEYANAFLIFIDHSAGHLTTVYKHRRIEGRGDTLFQIDTLIHPALGAAPGILIAVKNPPEDFERRFNQYVQSFRPTTHVSCVSAACSVMQELGLNQVAPRRYITLTGFMRHLAALSETDKEKLGLEFVVLGFTPDELIKRWTELERKDQRMVLHPKFLLGLALIKLLKPLF